nr:MAG TPA: METACASPASE MCA2, CYSTEINE PEPTIDASE, CASPASE/HEMOGLOBIN FOLD.4A [Caudoviricetes sp.]
MPKTLMKLCVEFFRLKESYFTLTLTCFLPNITLQADMCLIVTRWCIDMELSNLKYWRTDGSVDYYCANRKGE